jgi:GGDEF domain-containing protein
MKTITIAEKHYLELTKLAYEDLKFGTKNRNWLNVNQKHYKDKSIFVVVLDLNGLKKINDTLGHNAGDEYISTFLCKLRAYFEDLGDYEVVRFGGDEFMVISRNVSSRALKSHLGDIASFGIEKSRQGQILYFAMKKADKKMYKMKNKLYKKGVYRGEKHTKNI